MLDFTNATLDTNSLPKYEEVSLTALHHKYWNVVLINIAIFLLIIAAGLVTLLILSTGARTYIYIIVSIYLVFAVLLLFFYRLSVKKRGFALREKDIMYRNGIIASSTTIIPFSRIQHIALDEGLFSRIYGLGSLRIFTAGGASGSLHIPGIEIAHAKSIKELLMKQINEAR
ncbi:PH domain-containing protein [Pedobacter frigoris]|uniref:PH domain-containing protein n=1 Tax=Pedobacter frigoris TaxID=2571272 RepID=A0A4U1CGP8_9SPHI|nr:PH domain-containing protein [Pedobacter frigoris]TKC06348.1 PH domain-containing protein [Pedobacter frigoris]